MLLYIHEIRLKYLLAKFSDFKQLLCEIFQIITTYQDTDLIMHPVIQKAIHVKWKFYGKWDTIWKLLITFFYSIAWLVLAYHFPDERTYYAPFKSNGWKILFEVLIIVFALYFLIEVSVFFKTCFA